MKLFFRKYGSGKPLLILHGLFGQSDNWNTLAKKYSENGFEVYTVDQRNHGMSPHSTTWNYEVMAEDLKELIDTNNLLKPFLMGHSMGGKTVMFFELMFPGNTEKIIISDIAPRAYEPHNLEVLAALSSVNLEKISSRKEAEVQLSMYNLDSGTKQFLLKNLYWQDETAKKLGWRFNLAAIIKNYNNISVEIPQGSSNVPTLFLRGEKSNYISQADENEIKKHFPDSEIVTIAGSGHWIHAEKPQEFFAETLRFLNA